MRTLTVAQTIGVVADTDGRPSGNVQVPPFGSTIQVTWLAAAAGG